MMMGKGHMLQCITAESYLEWICGKHIRPSIGANAKSRDPNEVSEPLSRLVYISISVAKSTAECAIMEISMLFALQQQNSMHIYAKTVP